MATHDAGGHRHRRIDGNFNQGWGIALFVTALAVAAFVGAGLYKRATYHAPTDPLGTTQGAAAAAPAAH